MAKGKKRRGKEKPKNEDTSLLWHHPPVLPQHIRIHHLRLRLPLRSPIDLQPAQHLFLLPRINEEVLLPVVAGLNGPLEVGEGVELCVVLVGRGDVQVERVGGFGVLIRVPEEALLCNRRSSATKGDEQRRRKSRRTFVPFSCASLTRGRRIVSNALKARGTSSGFPPERARQTARDAPSSIA
jgi:hypothetical protein